MNYTTPIKKMFWTPTIINDADARLFICHLLLDMGIIPIHAKLSDWEDAEGHPVFTDEAALAYDNILNQLYIMPNGDPQLIISQITDEAIKWFDVDNNDPIKRFDIVSHTTGKVMYVAEFKSDYPIISILYSIDYTDGNKQYKRVGFGTLVNFSDYDLYLNDKVCGDFSYKFYDNASKKYISAGIGKDGTDGEVYCLSD